MSDFLHYCYQRELGKSARNKFEVLENFTCLRNARSILAETPLRSRSTYLLRHNSDNTIVAAAHADRTIAVFSVDNGCLLAKCIGHEGAPWTLAFHRTNPDLLASGCLGGNIQLWNLSCLSSKVNDCILPLNILPDSTWKQPGAIASVDFHPTYPILVAAWMQEVVFYNWMTGSPLAQWRFVADYSRVRWSKFSCDGALLYTATGNPTSQPSPAWQNSKPFHKSNRPFSSTLKPTTHISSPESAATGTSEVRGIRRLSRDQLLHFFISQPDVWYQELGICQHCSLRLVGWAGSLGPSFPSDTTNLGRGYEMAREVAVVAASALRIDSIPLTFVIKQLFNMDSRQGSLRDPRPIFLLGDAYPTSVAVIEDLPAKEFLRSRGVCCQAVFPTVSTNGETCCGGHAMDLVLTHRDLMRHSICRVCLRAFLRWAHAMIDWWVWDKPCSMPTVSTPPVFHASGLVTDVSKRTAHGAGSNLHLHEPESTRNSATQIENQEREMWKSENADCQPIGICIQCRAGATSSQTITTAMDTDGSLQKSHSYSQDAVLSLEMQHRPAATGTSKTLSVALDLIRARLNNATETTQITHLASEIISSGEIGAYLHRLLLLPQILLTDAVTQSYIPAFVIQQLRVAYLSDFQGPPSKRSKNATCRQQCCSPRYHPAISSESSTTATVIDTDTDSSNDSNSLSSNSSRNAVWASDESSNASLTGRDHSSLASQATDLAATLRRMNMDACSWNLPNPAKIVRPLDCHMSLPDVRQRPGSIFSYTRRGAQLLRLVPASGDSTHCQTPCTTSNTMLTMSPVSQTRHRMACPPSPISSSGVYNQSPNLMDHKGLTACCRCGSIVPHTFPIDPQSRLSAALCANLVLAGSRTTELSPPNSLRLSPMKSHRHEPASSSSRPATNPGGRQTYSSDEFATSFHPDTDYQKTQTDPVASSSQHSPLPRSTSNSVGSSNGVFYLINQSTNASVMNSMHRSITDAVAGLFADMDEHGSANNLRDVTYRVCRWELNLSGRTPPFENTHTSSTLRNTSSAAYERCPTTPFPFLANLAVSYNWNSLLIPHVRVFNDSSICLSPEGRMLAAFVSDAYSAETQLAVYRLQPKRRRGQRLCVHRFGADSPVCVDFSPTTRMLIVGFATNRLVSYDELRHRSWNDQQSRPSTSSDSITNSPCWEGSSMTPEESKSPLPGRYSAPIAKIFQLEQYPHLPAMSPHTNARGPSFYLREVTQLMHPSSFSEYSSATRQTPAGRYRDASIERWHRSLLLAPGGVSINTISWSEQGDILYGTTKGLVVLLKPSANRVTTDNAMRLRQQIERPLSQELHDFSMPSLVRDFEGTSKKLLIPENVCTPSSDIEMYR